MHRFPVDTYPVRCGLLDRLADSPHELPLRSGEPWSSGPRGEQEGADEDAEDEGAGIHGDSSLFSPASVLMNATIASLSSSGASRPNWYSNMASTASRSVAALPSWR